SALADDPENALTHANQGWALLHQGNHTLALEHFREALRLDPELEWARVGIVESLKARHLVYRIMLRFFLWMGRQGQTAQWVFVFGFVFGRRLLNGIARDNPKLAPILIPLSALLFAFLILTWLSSPLFNLLLRFNKFGRLALSREQRVESNWIGACFGVAVFCFVAYLIFRAPQASVGMGYFGVLLMPLAVTFQQDEGRPRQIMAACTAVIALLGLPALSLVLLGNASPWKNEPLAISLLGYFFIGAIFSTWIPALTGLRSSSR
ncbi:tetratricopeptide repeat protein, partial [Singulisphaera rosea]